METNSPHTPVLADDVVKYLAPSQGETYLDLTVGFGGHAALVLEQTDGYQGSVLVDRDLAAIEYVRNRFVEHKELSIIHSDMLSAAEQLRDQSRQFDLLLIDAGVSSPQFDQPERGFSFKGDGPLDMRMDQRQELTANDIVNSYSPQQLQDILKRYGEEPQAKRIVQAIVSARPLSSTKQLAELIKQTVHPKRAHGSIHPATQTFQALRIAVNSELDQLERTVALIPELLTPDGRVVMISFHSLEDRIFKQLITKHAGGRLDSTLKDLTDGPVTDSSSFNPRARSAKLRAAVKINKKRSDHAN